MSITGLQQTESIRPSRSEEKDLPKLDRHDVENYRKALGGKMPELRGKGEHKPRAEDLLRSTELKPQAKASESLREIKSLVRSIGQDAPSKEEIQQLKSLLGEVKVTDKQGIKDLEHIAGKAKKNECNSEVLTALEGRLKTLDLYQESRANLRKSMAQTLQNNARDLARENLEMG